MSVTFLYPLTFSFPLISLPLFFSSVAVFYSLPHCPIPQLALPPMSAPEFLLKLIPNVYATFALLLSFAPCLLLLSFLLNSPALTTDICIAGICTFLPPLTRSSVSFFFYTSIILSLSPSHTPHPLFPSLLIAKNTSSHSTLVGIF